MIKNNAKNRLEILRLHMLINSILIGNLFYTLPIKENNNIHDIEIKNYIFYFNSYYIENENFEDMITNISIKILQFYFECDDYNAIYCFTIHAFMQRYLWFHKQNYNNTYDDNYNILANNLLTIDNKKSTIIYFANEIQSIQYNNNNFNNIIHNLSHNQSLLTNLYSLNININSLQERCWFIFNTYNFDSLKKMNIFIKKYIHSFSQFILFLFLLRYHISSNILTQSMRYYNSAFKILNICQNIYFHSNSFQTKELKEQLNIYFYNFSLEKEDSYLKLI